MIGLKRCSEVVRRSVSASLLLVSASAFATEGDLSSVADSISGGFGSFLSLMLSGAYLAGFGFLIGAVFKFKQHRDNPTQVPIGTPFMMMMVSVALIFLPSLVSSSGSQVFGSGAKAVGVSGTGSSLTQATYTGIE